MTYCELAPLGVEPKPRHNIAGARDETKPLDQSALTSVRYSSNSSASTYSISANQDYLPHLQGLYHPLYIHTLVFAGFRVQQISNVIPEKPKQYTYKADGWRAQDIAKPRK